MIEDEIEGAALVVREMECRRLDAPGRRKGPNLFFELALGGRDDQPEMRSVEAEGAENLLGECHLGPQRCQIIGGLLAARQHHNLARAKSERTEQQIDADGGNVQGFGRDHPRRQTCAAPSEAGDEVPTLSRVVEQNTGIPAACIAIGLDQGLQANALVRDALVGVGNRAGWADGCASATAHAQVGLDSNAIAVGSDGPRRADIDALVAAFDPGAAVGADALVVCEELRLLELPDQMCELGDGQRLLEGIRTRLEIALRDVGHVEEALGGQIEDQIEFLAAGPVDAIEIDRPHLSARLDTRAVRPALAEVDLIGEVDRVLRTGSDAGVAARTEFEIDGIRLFPPGAECAQPAGERSEATRVDRVTAVDR